jgi:hypothetical protein
MNIEDLRNAVDYSIIADVLHAGDKMAVTVSPVRLPKPKNWIANHNSPN